MADEMADDALDDGADDITVGGDDDDFELDDDVDVDDEEIDAAELTRMLRDFLSRGGFGAPREPEEEPPGETCPSCGEPEVFRIVYGYPGARTPMNVILGGCIVSWGAPKKGCKACGWRPSLRETIGLDEPKRRSPFRFPVTADNEMPLDEDPSDFDEARADIARWIEKYSDKSEATEDGDGDETDG